MLHDLQRDFIQTLKCESAEAIESQLVDYKLKRAARMQIYRNHLRLTLRELLASTYPKLCRFLGDEAFTHLTASYCRTRPMSSPEAWRFGVDLADYMLESGNTRQQKVLSDLARLEWMAQGCFYAPDSATHVIARDLASLTPEILSSTQIGLAPDSGLISCSHAAYILWEQLSNYDEGLKPPEMNLVPQALSQLLVKRLDDGSIMLQPLEAGTYTFFSQLNAGSTLLDAYEAALDADAEFNIADTYKQAIELNLFASISSQIETD